jgi:hypothetical protein
MKAEQTFFMEAGAQTIRWVFGSKPAAGTYVLRLTAGGYTIAQRLEVK